jgi:hypothetical protein
MPLPIRSNRIMPVTKRSAGLFVDGALESIGHWHANPVRSRVAN